MDNSRLGYFIKNLTFMVKYAILNRNRRFVMLLWVLRMPKNCGETEIQQILDNEGVTLQTKKVGIYPVLSVPGGGQKDVITLLDWGFVVKLIEW